MKKIISLSMVLLLIASVAIAENPAVRYFQNGKGYVKVHYNRSKGLLSISSQADMNAQFISELDITVTCVHTQITRPVKDRNSNKIISPAQHKEEQYVVCNNTYVNIPINKTITVSDGVNNPPQDTNTDYYDRFNVVIGGNNMLVENATNNDMSAYNNSSSPKNPSTTTTSTTPAKTNNSGSQEKSVAVPFPNASINQNTSPVSSGGITCPVSGSSNQNIATITNPVVKSSGCCVRVYVNLTKSAAEGASVIVHIYDGNVVVGSGIVQVSSGSRQDYVVIDVPEPNHTYSARIASATCR